MADALVSLVVQELSALAKDEVKLLIDVKKEVKTLSSKFKAIQAVLEDAERQRVTDKAVQDWLGKLKEVAYEVEDLLDEWRIEAFRSQEEEEDDKSTGKKVRTCFLIPCLCFNRVKLHHNVGHKIREIIEKLNEISMEKRDFKLKENTERKDVESTPNMEKRETSLLIYDESEIFGREQYKESIIDELVKETGQHKKSFSVVSIVGMGGLGKTTLAQLVCNDERVMTHFKKIIIWVCVSDPFDVKKIAAKVIESLGGSTPENIDLDNLQCSLREAVGKMRFLLVLDDVWNESDRLWENLKVPLKGAAWGSKILVTTRSHKVAEVMETTHIHNLGILSDSDGLKLFKSRALRGMVEEESQALIELGVKIVERCKGVPLAIKAVGSLLHRRRETWYWQNVLKSQVWEWNLPKGDDILPALLLSYYSLPLHLKRCFSFCSVFPKDHYIKKTRLVQLWMAHGIIRSEGVDIEELGEMYFDDLLMLSLLQEADVDDVNDVMFYKMHDLVHDLANFVTTSDYCITKIGDPKSLSSNCHHLTLLLNRHVKFIPSPLCNAERLRTLMFLGSSRIEKIPDSLFNQLGFLRVLDLKGTCIGILPRSIGELKHLRYLNLSGSPIKELPETVTDLINLQTLELNKCESLSLLPSGMHKMVKLRHLEIKETLNVTFLPNGLGKLSFLRTLSDFLVPVADETRGCKIGELKNLNLRRGRLEIKNLERIMNESEAREAELDKKCRLNSLMLRCGDKGDEEWRTLGKGEMKMMESMFECLIPPHSNLKLLRIVNYAGSKFSSWLGDSKFSSLVEVNLLRCRKCTLLPCLGELPSLKVLVIEDADEVKVVGDEFYWNGDDRVKGITFPKLEKLFMFRMPNWENWKWSDKFEDVMPSLKTLGIYGCPKLKALPDRLPSTLRKVTVKNCGEVVWLPCNPLPLLEKLRLPGNALRMFFKSLLPRRLPPLETLQIEGTFEEFILCDDGCEQLDSLQTLVISDFPSLSSLPRGLGQFKALHTLRITNCSQMTCLPEGLGQFKSLKTLEIKNCSEFTSLGEELRLGNLEALHTLQIFDCSGLASLGDGLGLLQALQTLDLYYCDGLKSLPNCLGQLTSLRILDIYDCNNLKSLPNLQKLTMLQEINIYSCPDLKRALEDEKGEDWCNLSHIPCVSIDGKKYSYGRLV